MNTVIYWIARSVIALIQALPIRVVARLGRAGGGLAFFLTARYRRVTVDNLTQAFPEKTATEIREIAKENFRRLGENYASAIKTAAMTPLQMLPHFEFAGAEKILVFKDNDGPQSRIVAIVPVFKCAATYRGLNQPALNRLMVALRNTSSTRFYERRTESAALRAAMSDTGLLLGLLADQHAGPNGLRLPFFGRDCSTSAAPAVFALRYNCPLHTAICYRVRLAKWHIEVGDEIPTRINGEPRSSAEIMRDVNAEFEKAIRRDPANWFWVHRRWKPVEKRREKPPEEIVA